MTDYWSQHGGEPDWARRGREKAYTEQLKQLEDEANMIIESISPIRQAFEAGWCAGVDPDVPEMVRALEDYLALKETP